jgi:APA family basic amino acid/polyamine antiporter
MSQARAPATAAPAEPPRRFGLATATFVVVSSMVGTGVLTTSGYTVNAVGSNLAMLALWVVGGIIALCGALCIAELSASLPHSGGDYVFLRAAYGPLFGFLSGWVSLLMGFGGPIASSSYASAKYLLAPLHLGGPEAHLAQLGLASLAIVLLAVLHATSQHASARVQGATTLVKVAVLVALAIAGLAAGWRRWPNLIDPPTRLDGDLGASMLFSLVYIGYAYTGWNGAGYLAGEVTDPGRRLPRAILLGTALVTALYLALNLFYALALPASEVQALVARAGDRDVVAPYAWLAAERLFGRAVSTGLSVAVGLTLLASVSAFVMTGPRVAYAMARAGQFPAVVGRLTPRGGTPAVAIVVQVAWALIVLWSGSFEQIFVYSSVGLALFSTLTIAAVIVLRMRRPELARPFRTPGYPFTPLFFLLMTGALLFEAFRSRPEVAGLSLASIAAGVPAFWLWEATRRRGRSPAA